VRLRLWCCAAIFLSRGAAQELKLEELVQQALQQNPEILVAQKKYEAARQRPSQVSSLPDPMFSPGWNSNGNPLPGAGLGRDDTSNIGFSITQEIPYPGKQRLRANVARKEADAQFAEFEAVQLNVLSRVKQAYFRLQHYYAARDVLERSRAVLKSLLSITEVRYSAGKAAQQDVFKSQLQISLIDTKIIQLDRERHLREAEINSLLNLPSNTPLPKPGEPHVGQLPETLLDLQTAARERIADPDVPTLAEFPAKLAGFTKGVEGTLLFGEDRIVFRAAKPGESRTWRFSDIDNIASAGPFDFSVVTLEHHGAWNTGTRDFAFSCSVPWRKHDSMSYGGGCCASVRLECSGCSGDPRRENPSTKATTDTALSSPSFHLEPVESRLRL
jgi:Outer membrane efflux protein